MAHGSEPMRYCEKCSDLVSIAGAAGNALHQTHIEVRAFPEETLWPEDHDLEIHLYPRTVLLRNRRATPVSSRLG